MRIMIVCRVGGALLTLAAPAAKAHVCPQLSENLRKFRHFETTSGKERTEVQAQKIIIHNYKFASERFPRYGTNKARKIYLQAPTLLLQIMNII